MSPSTVKAPRRQQLPEEVASYVRELIISGEVKPGEFLRIEPISEALGVSNTPVREGLLSLRSQGFVELAPRRGFVVAPFSQEDVRDLFWTQAHLGGELAYRAASRITPEAQEQLNKFSEDYEKAIADGDLEAVARLGHQFHRIINLAAGSHRLAAILGSVVRHLPNRFYAGIEGQVTETQGDHPKIAAAMTAGDADLARRLMEEHILKGGDALIAQLQQRGVWGS